MSDVTPVSPGQDLANGTFAEWEPNRYLPSVETHSVHPAHHPDVLVVDLVVGAGLAFGGSSSDLGISEVVRLSPYLQVVRANTKRYVATVSYHSTIRYGSAGQLPRDAVDVENATARRDAAVATDGRALPEPAGLGALDTIPDARQRERLGSGHVTHYTRWCPL